MFDVIDCEIEGLSEWYIGDVTPLISGWEDYTLEVSPSCALRLTSAESRPFSAFMRVIGYFRKWLNFALNIPVNLLRIRGRIAESGEWVTINAIDSQRRDNQAVIAPIFDYQAVAHGFDATLTRWFNRCRESGRALETYFGSFEATGISYPIRLLLIVQSLEIFHVDFVSERVPQRYNSRQKLRTPKLTHTGKTSRIGSLEERLWDLAENYLGEYGKVLAWLLPEIDLFFARVVDTRNYYAHGDRPHEFIVHDETDFEALIRSTRAFAFLCWLRALDFPAELVWDIVTSPNNRRRFAPYPAQPQT